MRTNCGHGVVFRLSAHRTNDPQKGYPAETDFAEAATVTVLLPEEESDAFVSAITDKTDGSAKITLLGKSLQRYQTRS
ncbi:MAG: hypothetical protein C0413_02895 [Clostridiales bacterium]|nr:hypothetical protein [Clostridiales bacterium]